MARKLITEPEFKKALNIVLAYQSQVNDLVQLAVNPDRYFKKVRKTGPKDRDFEIDYRALFHDKYEVSKTDFKSTDWNIVADFYQLHGKHRELVRSAFNAWITKLKAEKRVRVLARTGYKLVKWK